MSFVPNPNFQSQILAQARVKLEQACAGLATYIKTVKLSKGRRSQGDLSTAGSPPYAWSGKFRQSIRNRWKAGDPNTQQVGSFPDNATVNIGAILEKGGTLVARKD